MMDLGRFDNKSFDRGASRLKEMLWVLFSGFLVSGPIPGSEWRIFLLRAFGARIADGVVIKPSVRVKFPWRLVIGENSWIGEGVWIDNLTDVRIGRNACISQAAYLCTGNHDWTKPTFDLVVSGITIEDQCWVGARATLAPGTQMHEGSILGLGAVGRGHLESWTIYAPKSSEIVAVRRFLGVEAPE